MTDDNKAEKAGQKSLKEVVADLIKGAWNGSPSRFSTDLQRNIKKHFSKVRKPWSDEYIEKIVRELEEQLACHRELQESIKFPNAIPDLLSLIDLILEDKDQVKKMAIIICLKSGPERYDSAWRHFNSFSSKYRQSKEFAELQEIMFDTLNICFTDDPDKRQYSHALKYCREISIDPAQSKSYIKMRKAIHKLMQEKLTGSFPRISATPQQESKRVESKAEDKKEVLSIPSGKLKKNGWYKVSEEVYAFDARDPSLSIIESQMKSIETEQKSLEEKSRQVVPGSTAVKNIWSTHDELEKQWKELEAQLAGNPERALERQLQVEERFFDSMRTKSSDSLRLARELQSNRLVGEAKEVVAVNIQNQPIRRLITAERAAMKTSLDLYGYGDLGWHRAPENRGDNGSNYAHFETIAWQVNEKPLEAKSISLPVEESMSISSQQSISLEEVSLPINIRYQYKQAAETVGFNNHVGNFWAEGLGTTSQIYVKLKRIIECEQDDEKSRDNQKRFASYLRRYSKNAEPITLKELRGMNAEASPDDVIILNKIFYHYSVKEITRRLLPKAELHKLPWALAYARTLTLMEEGYLTVKQVFAEDAPFGPPTSKEIAKNIEVVQKKFADIDELYEKYILKPKHALAWGTFFNAPALKPSVGAGGVLKDPSAEYRLVASRKVYRQELQEAFGGGYDTDGDGYETDDAELREIYVAEKKGERLEVNSEAEASASFSSSSTTSSQQQDVAEPQGKKSNVGNGEEPDDPRPGFY